MGNYLEAAMAPRLDPVSVICHHCKHEWTAYIASNCRFNLAIASMNAVAEDGCPNCGSKTSDTVRIRVTKDLPSKEVAI